MTCSTMTPTKLTDCSVSIVRQRASKPTICVSDLSNSRRDQTMTSSRVDSSAKQSSGVVVERSDHCSSQALGALTAARSLDTSESRSREVMKGYSSYRQPIFKGEGSRGMGRGCGGQPSCGPMEKCLQEQGGKVSNGSHQRHHSQTGKCYIIFVHYLSYIVLYLKLFKILYLHLVKHYL